MTKRRKTKAEAKKPRHRTGQNLNAWLSVELMHAFEVLRQRNRRTIKAEVEVMMEQYLKANGLWPPPPSNP